MTTFTARVRPLEWRSDDYAITSVGTYTIALIDDWYVGQLGGKNVAGACSEDPAEARAAIEALHVRRVMRALDLEVDA